MAYPVPMQIGTKLSATADQAYFTRPKVPQSLYSPLHEWQTRVLEIYPADHEDYVRCELHVADIIYLEGIGLSARGKRIHYDALSYSWGYAEPTGLIYCNDWQCFVSPSLRDALHALRRSDSSIFVWVDAFSINQADLAEKSNQVQMMMTIYRKAREVCIWLGDEAVVTSLAEATDHLRLSEVDWLTHKDPEKDTRWQARGAFRRIVASMSYFTRVWIRQELFAARQISIVGKQKRLSWLGLSRAADWTDRGRKNDVARLVFGDSNDALTSLCILSKDGACLNDLDTDENVALLLRSCLAFQATDEKDKAYALVGALKGASESDRSTSSGGVKDVLEVDYSKSVRQVYTDLTVYLMSRVGPMTVLQMHGSALADARVPSWSFDWDNPSLKIIQVALSQCTSPSSAVLSLRKILQGIFRDASGSPDATSKYWDFHNSEPSQHRIQGYRLLDSKDGGLLCICGFEFARIVGNLRACPPDTIAAIRRHWLRIATTDNLLDEGLQERLGHRHADFWRAADINIQLQSEPGLVDYRELFRPWESTILFPPAARAGDLVVWLNGASMPVIVRPDYDDLHLCSYIGPVFIVESPVPETAHMNEIYLSFFHGYRSKPPPLVEFLLR